MKKNNFLFILLLLIVSDCFASGKKDQGEIIIVDEHIINEFRDNEKAALRKYKNKKLQVTAAIASAGVAKSRGERRYAVSTICLQKNDYYFNFLFDYNVHSQYAFKRWDKATIQGTLKEFNKRTRVDFDLEKRKTNPDEKWTEEVEWWYFGFSRDSEIVGIVEVNLPPNIEVEVSHRYFGLFYKPKRREPVVPEN